MRRLLAPAAVTLALAFAGCLGSTSPPDHAAPPVRVQLEQAHMHPPDAVAAGAGAVTVAVTRDTRAVVRGAVSPAASDVRLLDGPTLMQSAIAQRRGGSFEFALEHLPPGANRYVLTATAPGHAPWRHVLRVVRLAPPVHIPRTVVVPRVDVTPGEAELHLDRRHLVAVAIGRDAGGMARVRVSANLQVRCRSAGGKVSAVPLIVDDPPPQIGEIRAVPGARVPGELRRRTDLGAAARARCAEFGATLAGLRGIVWAEANNAHALDRYSANIPIER